MHETLSEPGAHGGIDAVRRNGPRWPPVSTGLMLLASHLLLALAMHKRYGTYTPMALAFGLASFACLAIALLGAWRGRRFDWQVPGETAFAVALVVLLLAAVRKPAGYFTAQADPRYELAYHVWLSVAVLFVIITQVGPARQWLWLRQVGFVLAVIAALAFRIGMLVAVPAPDIDTFRVTQESCQHLLEGRNPYTTPVSDFDRGLNQFGYRVRASVYLPANLYLQTPAYLLTGDSRAAHVCAEAVVVLVLWGLAWRRWGKAIAGWLGLLFLYHPCGLFVIEQGWTDPLILLVFALYLWLHDRRRYAAAAAVFGYLLSLKQYLAFFLVQWLYVERRWTRIVLALVVGGLTMLPFLLAAPAAFLREGVLFNLRVPFRHDGLTIFGFLGPLLGVTPPPGWSITVGALAGVLLIVPLRQIAGLRAFLFGATITTFSIFLFGSQGFCNYYYLVSGPMLFLIALGGRREE